MALVLDTNFAIFGSEKAASTACPLTSGSFGSGGVSGWLYGAVICDNISTTGPTVTSISGPSGAHGAITQFLVPGLGADAGSAAIIIFFAPITTPYTNTTSGWAINLSNSVTAKVGGLGRFTAGGSVTFTELSQQQLNNVGGQLYNFGASGSHAGKIAIMAIGSESNTVVNFQAGGSPSGTFTSSTQPLNVATSGGGAASNIAGAMRSFFEPVGGWGTSGTIVEGGWIVVEATEASGLTPVTKTLQTSWHVMAGVTKTLQTSWNVLENLTPVTKTLATTWNVRAGTVKTLNTTWNVRAGVTKTLETSWNVAGAALTPVTKTLSTSWHVRANLTKTLSTSWGVRSEVTKSLSTTWHVRGNVTKTLNTLWHVRANVVKTLNTTWIVRSGVTKTLTTSWNVAGNLTPVIKTLSTSWNVIGVVIKTLTTTWIVRANVTKTLSTSWHVKAGVNKSLTATWNVRGSVVKTLGTTWNVRSGVSKSLNTTWGVRAGVVRLLSTSWNVAGTGATFVQFYHNGQWIQARVLVGNGAAFIDPVGMKLGDGNTFADL